MLDKVKFWKKKEVQTEELEQEPIEESIQEPTQGIPEFGVGRQEETNTIEKNETSNMDSINSKLDAIKSELENVSLRIKNIERIAQSEEKKQKIWK